MMDEIKWINVFIPEQLLNIDGESIGEQIVLLFGCYEVNNECNILNVNIMAVSTAKNDDELLSSTSKQIIDLSLVEFVDSNLCYLGRLFISSSIENIDSKTADSSETNQSVADLNEKCDNFINFDLILFKNRNDNDLSQQISSRELSNISLKIESLHLNGMQMNELNNVAIIFYDSKRLMNCQSFDLQTPGNRIEFLSFILKCIYNVSIMYENQLQSNMNSNKCDLLISTQATTTFIYHYNNYINSYQYSMLLADDQSDDRQLEICDENNKYFNFLEYNDKNESNDRKYNCNTSNISNKSSKTTLLLIYLFWFFNFLDRITMRKTLFLTHLKFRVLQIHYLLNLFRKSPTKRTISLGNLVLSMIFDQLLGVIVTMIIFHYTDQKQLIKFVNTNVNLMVNKTNNLLILLQSMPAGLKLNQPFNYALSQLMFYHIYLWQNYMLIFQSLFPMMMIFTCYSGVFGATFAISLLYDLYNMITVHIFCFYGYTSRVYNFQIAGIISLWRLFRGKKYNPLRNRIDSYSYENVHLFIGTILLTIFIFLLPTVLMYYVVLFVLRLLTLAIKQSLFFFVDFLTTLPVYTLWLWTINSNIISNRIYFRRLNHHEHCNYENRMNDENVGDDNNPQRHSSIFYMETYRDSFENLFNNQNDCLAKYLKNFLINNLYYDEHKFEWNKFFLDILQGNNVQHNLPYWFSFLFVLISIIIILSIF